MGYFIGLMSGTSADSVDAALVEFRESVPHVIATEATPLPPILRNQILALYHSDYDEIDRLGALDRELGITFAEAALQLLRNSGIGVDQILAIGSHGQTIRHRPRPSSGAPFTLQIGDANLIAEVTGITTVADFRRRDMAVGGQGAPLAPGFHQAVFGNTQHHRAVVNIGGIANITWLPFEGVVTGYDIGPGNGLMDAWVWRHRQTAFDANGQWAAAGKIEPDLLATLLRHPYFDLPAPKSTGREEFHWRWLDKVLTQYPQVGAVDVQATLLELTARSIAREVVNQNPRAEVIVCGGGAHNAQLMHRLQTLLPEGTVISSAQLGIPPDFVEAVAFAWLAMRTLNSLPGNLPAVTGARKEVILGAIYPGLKHLY